MTGKYLPGFCSGSLHDTHPARFFPGRKVIAVKGPRSPDLVAEVPYGVIMRSKFETGIFSADGDVVASVQGQRLG
jgi:hypothetical protein